jgi:hypothetical protein
MKNNFLSNLWGYGSSLVVFVFDHWSGFAAFVLFVMQGVYQFYRIKQARKDCEDV